MMEGAEPVWSRRKSRHMAGTGDCRALQLPGVERGAAANGPKVPVQEKQYTHLRSRRGRGGKTTTVYPQILLRSALQQDLHLKIQQAHQFVAQ